MIVPARHPPRPPGPPRPDHRRDVMDQRQASRRGGAAACATRQLNPELSIVTTASGRCARIAATVSRTRRRITGARGNTSATPVIGQIGERDEALEPLLRACARRRSRRPAARPPVRSRSAAISAPPSASPEGSPVMMKMNGASRSRGPDHAGRTPTTNSPARSAARMTSSRSSTSVAPASTAMPRSPASAASVTVCAPIVGRSARRSCPGFSHLDQHAARPLAAQRRRSGAAARRCLRSPRRRAPAPAAPRPPGRYRARPIARAMRNAALDIGLPPPRPGAMPAERSLGNGGPSSSS